MIKNCDFHLGLIPLGINYTAVGNNFLLLLEEFVLDSCDRKIKIIVLLLF